MKKIKTPKNNTITNVLCSITITIESHKIKVAKYVVVALHTMSWLYFMTRHDQCTNVLDGIQVF